MGTRLWFRYFRIGIKLGIFLVIVVWSWYIFGHKKTIVLTPTGFYPRLVYISVGDRVTFRSTSGNAFWPASNVHPSHLIYPEFDPKRPIAASASYSFVFKSSGSFRYHDHLDPRNYGTIVVAATWQEALSTRVQSIWKVIIGDNDTFVDCQSESLVNRTGCWELEVRRRIKNYGIAAAFEYISEMQATAEFQRVCHDMAHIVGREVFLSRKWQENLPNDVDYRICDYGFFHGYMELMIGTGEAPVQARTLCDSIQGTQGTGQLIASCYHGIGHGAVIAHERPDIIDPWVLVPQGIGVCEAATTDWGKRENCVSGVIDGLAALITGGQFPLTDSLKRNPFAVCETLDFRYHMTCRMSFVGLLRYVSDGNIARVAAIIEDTLERPTLPLLHNVISLIVRDRMSDDLPGVLSECASVSRALQRTCEDGVLEGFFLAKISADTQPEEMVSVCQTVSGLVNQQLCYREIVRQIYDWKGHERAVVWCAALPDIERTECTMNVETYIREKSI